MIDKVTVSEGQLGEYKIVKKHIKPTGLEMIRMGSRACPEGDYTFLYRGSTLLMSDTPAEMRDHYEAVREAKGNVLIVGLGIGMVLNAIAKKEDVKSITVVELSSEVLTLVKDHYDNMYPNKITFINEDIFNWKPNKEAYFDCAWYDIWDYITEGNLDEMKKLHRKFGRKTGWQGSWGRDVIKSNMSRRGW